MASYYSILLSIIHVTLALFLDIGVGSILVIRRNNLINNQMSEEAAMK